MNIIVERSVMINFRVFSLIIESHNLGISRTNYYLIHRIPEYLCVIVNRFPMNIVIDGRLSEFNSMDALKPNEG